MDNILRSRNRNWLFTKISSIFVIFCYFLIEGGARQKFKFVRPVHSPSLTGGTGFSLLVEVNITSQSVG